MREHTRNTACPCMFLHVPKKKLRFNRDEPQEKQELTLSQSEQAGCHFPWSLPFYQRPRLLKAIRKEVSQVILSRQFVDLSTGENPGFSHLKKCGIF